LGANPAAEAGIVAFRKGDQLFDALGFVLKYIKIELIYKERGVNLKI
jgi:hypothetical protein